MIVKGRMPTGVAITAADFADLTPVPVVAVAFSDDGKLGVTFASDLDDATRAAVRRRIISRSRTEEQVRAAVAASAAEIEAWPPMTAPTMVQIVQRFDVLTRQIRGIARLLQDDDT